MTVQDYLIQLKKGRTIRPIEDVNMLFDLAPPDLNDPNVGFDVGITPEDAYKAHMALTAWLLLYQQYHGESYQAMVDGRPT